MLQKIQTTVVILGALALATVGAALPAQAGSVEQLLEARGLAGGASYGVSRPMAATAALGKFTASGTVTTTSAVGGCPGSFAALSCNPSSNCNALTIAGPLTATTLGKSTLSACMTVDVVGISPNLNVCFDGVGAGTITSSNGKNSVTIALSGLFCMADEFPTTAPTTTVFQISGAYSVESGTGSFASAPSGAGAVSITAMVPTSGSNTFNGAASFTGNIAK